VVESCGGGSGISVMEIGFFCLSFFVVGADLVLEGGTAREIGGWDSVSSKVTSESCLAAAEYTI